MMRSGLDRRRLSDAFFKYNAASWLAENGKRAPPLPRCFYVYLAGDLDVDVSLLFKSDVSKTGEAPLPSHAVALCTLSPAAALVLHLSLDAAVRTACLPIISLLSPPLTR